MRTNKTNQVFAVEYITDSTGNRRTVALFNEFNDAKLYAENEFIGIGEWYTIGNTHFSNLDSNHAVSIYPFSVH